MPKTRLEFEDGWISAGATAKAEAARDKRADMLAVIAAHPGELSRSAAASKSRVRKAEGLRLLDAMIQEGYVQEMDRKLWPDDNGSQFPPI